MKMNLKNMKMDAKEAKEYAQPAALNTSPAYPYGLKIDLNKEGMEKLGIKKMPDIGQKMFLHAIVEVCCVNESKTLGGDEYRSMSLQITDMQVDAIKEKVNTEEAAKKLYGAKS